MQCLATVLLLVVALLYFSGMLPFGGTKRRRQRALQQIATQFRGEYRPPALFRGPEVVLRYGSTIITIRSLSATSASPQGLVEVAIHWPVKMAAWEIRSVMTAPAMSAYAELSWSPSTESLFRRRFVGYADQAAELNQLLTSGVQWQIERLANLGRDERLRIQFRDQTLRIHKPWTAVDPPGLAQLVQGSQELYDQCVLARATGIQFLHTDEAQPLEEVRCPVCGDRIEDQMVVCLRCKTPHHHDCWQYAGSCAVYGCRESQCTAPSAARRVGPARGNL